MKKTIPNKGWTVFGYPQPGDLIAKGKRTKRINLNTTIITYDEVTEFTQEQFDFLEEKKMNARLPKTLVGYIKDGYIEQVDPVEGPAIPHAAACNYSEFVNTSKYNSIGIYALVREYHKEIPKFVHTSKDHRSYHYSQLATPHLKNILAQDKLNPRKRAILEYELERRELEKK